MITFNDVTFRYPYDDFDVLKGASFTLHEEVNTLLCDVQSGKTTVCRLLMGMLVPLSGQVSVPRREILYLPRSPVFFENKSVRYNLEYPLRARKKLAGNEQIVVKNADVFGFSDQMNVKVKKLSAEQKRMLALARGLTVPRGIVLLDGFFDGDGFPTKEEGATVAQQQKVLSLFSGCEVTVVLTCEAHRATGHSVVLDGGSCVYEGESSQATALAEERFILAKRR